MVVIHRGSELRGGGRRRRWEKTKIEETQEETETSSDEADAQGREEEARGGGLVTLAPEIPDLEQNVKMEFSNKNGGGI